MTIRLDQSHELEPTMWSTRVYFPPCFKLQIAFVITGGKQNKTGQYTPLARASKLLKDKGVQIVAIGVGELSTVVDDAELLDISSSNEDVFVATSFEELQNPGNARLFRRRVCDGKRSASGKYNSHAKY